VLHTNDQVDAHQVARETNDELDALVRRSAASNGFGAAEVAMRDIDDEAARIEREVRDMLSRLYGI
jgi:hypothetical protein